MNSNTSVRYQRFENIHQLDTSRKELEKISVPNVSGGLFIGIGIGIMNYDYYDYQIPPTPFNKISQAERKREQLQQEQASIEAITKARGKNKGGDQSEERIFPRLFGPAPPHPLLIRLSFSSVRPWNLSSLYRTKAPKRAFYGPYKNKSPNFIVNSLFTKTEFIEAVAEGCFLSENEKLTTSTKTEMNGQVKKQCKQI